MILVRKTIEWLDSRTGLASPVRNFLSEEIPSSAGWAQVFGSIALFLFFTQAITGVLLAFNYAPTPGEAYTSLLYILRKVSIGGMVHGLHHWGASLMIIVVFLHMAQVFLYGAYKKPREATWIAGVALLLLTLAFGLTGYLLPWDNRAYWGTMVTTNIIGTVPFLGGLLLRLIGAGHGIGVVTFSRFYAFHTVVLPAITATLIAVHVYFVRLHGITARADATKPVQLFYPKQAFRDLAAISLTFAVLFMAAALLQVPLERLADPTDTSYVPRPEWYFLFLFQLLKLFQGSLEPIGTVVLPTVAVLALFAVPFMDRTRVETAKSRMLAIAAVVLVFSAWATLTAAAVLSSPPGSSSLVASVPATEWSQLPAEQIAGLGYFRAGTCDRCHNLLAGQPKPGPSLLTTQVHHPRPWLIQHLNYPGQLIPSMKIAPTHFSLPQLNALLLFIENLTPDTASKLADVPAQALQGAQLYVVSGCGSCHKLNEAGGGIGPALNGVAVRRSQDWIKAHFSSPQTYSPGSIMPPYHFSRDDESAILRYLSALPE
jgi:ubiquinol-cytochrome c reductase cytochrome b subunit